MENKKNKIFIAGHRGLAGSAFDRVLKANGYENIILADKAQLDLLDFEKVKEFISTNKFDWIIIAAAKVGGIIANKSFPVEFFQENIQIQNNLLRSAYEAKVKKVLFLGSNCIYPKAAPIPFAEESLFKGEMESSNEAYGLAKIAGIKLCKFYNSEYGTNFISIIPTGLFGPNDNYHPEHAHVLPMLLRRFHEAKLANDTEVTIWGSGTPLREFLYSDDMARAGIYILENLNASDIGEAINIGPGHELSIRELAEKIKKLTGFTGRINLDETKPDGIMRKKLLSDRINKLGFQPQVSFESGLKMMYEDFLTNPNLRT